MIELTDPASTAGDRYLLLADISGYTAFMTSVEQAKGLDFSHGIHLAPDTDSEPGRTVFNRALSIKDTWAKVRAP